MTVNGDSTETVVVSAPETPAPEAAPVVEAAAPAALESAPAAEPEGSQSARWAAIAKREKEAVLREKRAKDEAAAREATLAEREAKLKEREAGISSIDQLLALAKEKPTEFLEKTGLDFKQLTDLILKEGEAPTADDRVAKLEERLTAKEKAEAERADAAEKQRVEAEKRAVEEAVTGFKASIADYVTKNAEKYELVALEGADDLVFDVIEAHFAATWDEKTKRGEQLAVEVAAEKVEEYLLAEASKKYKLSKKLTGLFAHATPPTPAPSTTPPSVVSTKPSPTLTNKTGVTGTVPPAPSRMLEPREIAEKYRKMKRSGTSVQK